MNAKASAPPAIPAPPTLTGRIAAKLDRRDGQQAGRERPLDAECERERGGGRDARHDRAADAQHHGPAARGRERSAAKASSTCAARAR